ncbi:MAG: hypothetical protein CSA81_07895 [Acidobacteria bacterium]|nr:MAG: hypothetical protein CSA81_07895 [Acidobacteriota bacterium]
MNKRAGTKELSTDSVLNDSIGWVLVITGVMTLLAFISYHPADPSFFHHGSSGKALNLLGKIGANVSAFFVHFTGIASLFLPFAVLFIGIQTVRRRVNPNWVFGFFGVLTMLLCLMAFAGSLGDTSYKGYPFHWGGLIGQFLWDTLCSKLNTIGSYLALLLILGLSILITTQLRIMQVIGFFAGLSTSVLVQFQTLFNKISQRLQADREKREHLRILREERRKHSVDLNEEEGLTQTVEKKTKKKAIEKKLVQAPSVELQEAPTEPGISDHEVAILEGEALFVKPEEALQEEIPFEIEQVKWKYPNIDFFEPPHEGNEIDRDELHEKALSLEGKLGEFDVTGTMKNIIPGPIVTTYEFKPDPGIKYSKIVGLQDDLCLALGAESMRIDRIAGRYSIGFEVPNNKKETIFFREMISNDHFKDSPSKLMLTLGKTIEGEPYCSDLAKMPHLLIAGQTGSGKSVGLNAMVCSILMKATPDEVKFIMIDPKMVEMVAYNDIPHLITPVVNDCLEAASALKWAVLEMEVRYKKLARYMCRGIDQFNSEFIKGHLSPEEGDQLDIMPRIVIIIDELADLMMVARGEVEESIARLAQKSRAVGIHLILATQRPSTDILTGLIKSNLPCRMSYRVAQRNDSRIILDSNGADQLLGKGDALFLPPGSARLIRVHAPWLSPREIKTLTSFLKKQAKPDYNTAVVQDSEEMDSKTSGGAAAQKTDAMYDQAARLVVSSGQASVSYLQRKLSVGYARAAKLIDMMEQDGIVGPHRGSKARDILVSPDYFDPIDNQLR